MNLPEDTLVEQICAASAAAPLAWPLALVVAHPDDEVIGIGSRLPRLGPELRLIYVTDGAPRNLGDAWAAGFLSREAYAHTRQTELQAALALAGIPPGQTLHLGLVDQEASLHLERLARMLAIALRRLAPRAVLTQPYEGGHPDHDATAFAVQMACRLLHEEGFSPPTILEMTSYHNGPRGLTPGEFLPWEGCNVQTVELTAAERKLKQRMLACFATQRATLRYFPATHERFRPAPAYDFTHPPHTGRLFYEHYDWGMIGSRWRRLAGQALEALGVGAHR